MAVTIAHALLTPTIEQVPELCEEILKMVATASLTNKDPIMDALLEARKVAHETREIFHRDFGNPAPDSTYIIIENEQQARAIGLIYRKLCQTAQAAHIAQDALIARAFTQSGEKRIPTKATDNFGVIKELREEAGLVPLTAEEAEQVAARKAERTQLDDALKATPAGAIAEKMEFLDSLADARFEIFNVKKEIAQQTNVQIDR